MRGISTLWLAVLLGACGSCGGAHIPTSDRQPVPVRFTITNGTAETIYLVSQGYCAFEALAIGDLGLASGQSLTCEDAKTGPCPDFGACAQAGVRPLAPGESWELDWEGYAYETVVLEPEETGENCPTTCITWLPVEPGRYPVTVQARSTCEGESCDCELTDDYASCHPEAPFEGEPDLRAQGQLTVPETATTPVTLELRFE